MDIHKMIEEITKEFSNIPIPSINITEKCKTSQLRQEYYKSGQFDLDYQNYELEVIDWKNKYNEMREVFKTGLFNYLDIQQNCKAQDLWELSNKFNNRSASIYGDISDIYRSDDNYGFAYILNAAEEMVKLIR